MSIPSWLNALRVRTQPQRSRPSQRLTERRRRKTRRLLMEGLENRCLLAFTAAVDYPVGTGPQDVLAADFNNDNIPDLAVPNYYSSDVSVLLGNANGTFQAAQTSATGANPRSVAVGDFNADGKLDLATANTYDVSILLGNSDGTFQAPGSISIGGQYDNPDSVAVGDFNSDGKMDLGVTSNSYGYYSWWYGYSYSGRADVLLGNGDGSFAAPITTSLTVGWHTSAVVADFNGDGNQDFATVNSDYWAINVLLGDGTGSLSSHGWLSTGEYPLSLAAGDASGDGKTDLVTANYHGNSVSVLLGNGLGDFAAAQNYATGSGPDSVVLGDFNRDAKLDIATANYSGDNVSILRGVGDGTFPTIETFAVGAGTNAVSAGDFNGDGWLDAATANGNGNTASVLINDQSWSSPPPPTVSVSDASVTEGNTGDASATFTLTLSAASTVDVTVHYDTADISAASGSDYTAVSGDVIIPAGQTSATFVVAVTGDRLAEPTEAFAVNLSGATNATVVDGQGIGAILDDEPRISISDVTKYEGKHRKTTYFSFTVTLSAAYDQAVTMSFSTADGTATSGSGDYVAKTGTLTFNPGETTKTITIEVKGDRTKEANETFYLDLFDNSSNSLFTKNRGIGTILNDDR